MAQITHSRSSAYFWTRVLIKACALFLGINLLFAVSNPFPDIGRLSIYNTLVPGRQRLPYGENPASSYNISLYNIPAMFASHELSGTPKSANEYRVIFIGDSSTWGYLLSPSETLPSVINQKQLQLSDGRQVHAYNLGYPVMSLTKDLLILNIAVEYEPDLIVWPITLESLPNTKQLYPPLLQNNPDAVRQLITTQHLNLDINDPSFIELNFYQQTLIGQRKELADWLRLQIFGIMWAATGIDQEIPDRYVPRQEDLSSDLQFYDLQPPELPENALAVDVLQAAMRLAGDIPVLLINEPMFISQGANSDVRYNFFYPRWAYDAYRKILSGKATEGEWHYLDLWDSVAAEEFTNSAVHMSPRGTRQLAEKIGREILSLNQP